MDRYTGTAGVSNAVSDLIILGGFVLGVLALGGAYLPVPQDGNDRDSVPVDCFVYPLGFDSAKFVQPSSMLKFCYRTENGGKNLFYIPLSAAIAATVGNMGCVYGRIRRNETSEPIFVAYILYFVVLLFSFLLLLVPGTWTPEGEMHRQIISASLVLAVCGLHFYIGLIQLLAPETRNCSFRTRINGSPNSSRKPQPFMNVSSGYFLLNSDK